MSERVKEGSEVTVHFVGKLDNGTEFDNSYAKNTPFTFTVGNGQVIQGFEDAVLNREIEEKFSVKISKEQAYGEYSEDHIHEIPKEQANIPEDTPLGSHIEGTAPDGNKFICRLKDVNDDVVTLDLNHPLAGENLNFEIEILGFK